MKVSTGRAQRCVKRGGPSALWVLCGEAEESEVGIMHVEGKEGSGTGARSTQTPFRWGEQGERGGAPPAGPRCCRSR